MLDAYDITVYPRTGRPLGDHGTAMQAINYAADVIGYGDPHDALAFLNAWREGDAAAEWPEFYDWLRRQDK
jgi:hypothetical protein